VWFPGRKEGETEESYSQCPNKREGTGVESGLRNAKNYNATCQSENEVHFFEVVNFSNFIKNKPQ